MQCRVFDSIQAYQPIVDSMKDFTLARDQNTDDALWFMEHTPVFTQGLAGKKEHILHKSDIPIIQSDRGGQVTYHGPGQLMIYTLVDLKRQQKNIKTFVQQLEHSIIELLALYGISGDTQCGAPGVYVNNAKIASVGLRVKKGCAYHGLSFNVNMDLTPFTYINPCGYAELAMCQLSQWAPTVTLTAVRQQLTPILLKNLKE